MKVHISTLPVNKKCCSSCPFKLDELGRQRDSLLASQVIERTLFQAQQICHSTEGKNRKATTRCRGAFDYTKTIYERLGMNLISE